MGIEALFEALWGLSSGKPQKNPVRDSAWCSRFDNNDRFIAYLMKRQYASLDPRSPACRYLYYNRLAPNEVAFGWPVQGRIPGINDGHTGDWPA